jgi:hypothetical protein
MLVFAKLCGDYSLLASLIMSNHHAIYSLPTPSESSSCELGSYLFLVQHFPDLVRWLSLLIADIRKGFDIKKGSRLDVYDEGNKIIVELLPDDPMHEGTNSLPRGHKAMKRLQFDSPSGSHLGGFAYLALGAFRGLAMRLMSGYLYLVLVMPVCIY